MADAGPSNPPPSIQPYPIGSAHPNPRQEKCHRCKLWYNQDQFLSPDATGRLRKTVTCPRCRPKRKKGGKPSALTGERQPSPEPATTSSYEPRPTPPCLLHGPPDPTQELADKRDPEDYNIRSEERKTLLNRLKAALKNSPVTPAFWACCQLCNTSTLTIFVSCACINPVFIRSYLEESSLIHLLWTQRYRTSPHQSPMMSSPQSVSQSDVNGELPRSNQTRNLCRKRDGNRCLLTNQPDPQVCYIFPHNMLSSADAQKLNNISKFWELLSAYWGEDKMETWRRQIFPFFDHPEIGVDEVFNLICLSPDAHDMWNQGAFALRPLDGSDEYKLEVEFVWQTRYKHPSSSKVDLLMEPASSQGLYASPSHLDSRTRTLVWTEFSNPPKSTHLFSGARFTFTTTNPQERPLPSKHLLEMQWALQRLTAMAAAAEEQLHEGSHDDSMYDGGMNTVNTAVEDIFEWIPLPENERLMSRGPTDQTVTPSIAVA